ncbi:dihydroxyacetone kinase/dihydroxyacetone kinase, C-terminal domain [Devosia crocina]|uniref:Dihydroxyacetone kinase/dihydroxyacetone kinase, C-terminal domain n=1 Tax=Devosia crocina TaxID=429728 RepID=A0A1I7NVU4_9HYPH|nr:DAK2 domain-containing protein [Devosia crocina]SFV38693.1 dihydroxyacetone kinase/dihydroxyacetone kinase, C-terminal domain [Devosia crocina]
MAITLDTLADAIARANASMASLADVLNAADAKLGDGDTGTMLVRLIGTFAAVDVRGADNLGAGFMALAKAGAASTGSSLGTLIITAMMTAGKANAGKSDMDWADLSGLLTTIRDAAMARGKAELGAKTIIDGLDALASGIAGKTDASEVAAAAAEAMNAVLAEFRNRPSAMGRARMFAEKSVGLDDPGMLALAEIVRSLAKGAQHSAAPVA